MSVFLWMNEQPHLFLLNLNLSSERNEFNSVFWYKMQYSPCFKVKPYFPSSQRGCTLIESPDSNFLIWVRISLRYRIMFLLINDYIKVCVSSHKQICMNSYLWSVTGRTEALVIILLYLFFRSTICKSKQIFSKNKNLCIYKFLRFGKQFINITLFKWFLTTV